VNQFRIIEGDARTALAQLESGSVRCCVTSPPYWGLRDYGTAQWEGGAADCDHAYNHGTQGKTGERADRTFTAQAVYRNQCRKCGAQRVDQQLGLETTPEEYIARMVEVFAEVRRVLVRAGTLWLNIGDSYAADAGADRKPTTLAGARVPAGWTNRSQPKRIHAASRHGKDCDPKRGDAANGQPYKHTAGNFKPKDLCMMPARVAIALQADGWYLRSDIIWHKPNPMPESVTDRPTKAHEYLFLLAKSERYYYDAEAIQEKASDDTHARYARGRSETHKWADGGPGNQTIAKSFEHMRKPGVNPKCAEAGSGIKMNDSFSAAVKDVVEFRNKRSVWTIPTEPFPEAHFATFPQKLIEPCIMAGCPSGGTVLDPFAGSGTTGLVAKRLGCEFIGIELNAEYIEIAERRTAQEVFDYNPAGNDHTELDMQTSGVVANLKEN
jgi:site-specific DNA-methyltransferase (cytosine-N4-specific)